MGLDHSRITAILCSPIEAAPALLHDDFSRPEVGYACNKKPPGAAVRRS
jgi:hypothetical protein